MTERPSFWTRHCAPAVALLGALGALGAAPDRLAGQDDLDGVCAAAQAPSDCYLAAAAVRTIQPRIGLVLWGGSPVPGTANTVGLRRRSSPRVAVSGRVALAPAELPPLLDRSRVEGSRGVLTALSLQTTVGLSHGTSPLPTVGGFLAVDLIGRASVARVPQGKGFDRPTVWGWALGARLGLLRESLLLPAASLTATYGRSFRFAFGDPEGLTTDGAIRGAVSGLHVTAAASRWILGLRLGGGVSYDRYGSDVTVRWGGATSPLAQEAGADAVTKRWSGFGTLTWTRVIYHLVLELGWQESPVPTGLPAEVAVNPVGWWTSVAVRVTP